MKMKKISILFFIVISITLLAYLYSSRIQDKLSSKVIFINQVRGTECCQRGSLENTKRQLELFKKYKMPATFVLRYDAIIDERFTSLLKSYSSPLLDYGIFFEVTPKLARDAGITYLGTEERWYRAQYAFLVGYSQEERKKIIDTTMAVFKNQFGTYPKTTGGWMIDTYSAEYLSTVYGVESHEITREQWGTDGYALYGGSILSAYTPSKNWLFMPAQTEKNTLPLRILRQTLSDPVHNYGDLTSGYTSQPNDYGRTKNFDYFKYLLTQVGQYSQSIAVLGLENSLETRYQNIFEEQVRYISEVIPRQNIMMPKDVVEINRINYASGTDYENKSYRAFWIETPKYRARIIQKNDYVQLTDLRVFDETITDPYSASSSGEKTAYWETPFIFDSSKNGEHKTINSLSIKTGELFRFFGNEDWIRERTNPVVNEQFLQEINGIVFPQLKKGTNASISNKNGTVMLKYVSAKGKDVLFTFDEDTFFVRGINSNEYEIKGSIGKNTKLLQEGKDNGILFTPLSNQTQATEVASLQPTVSSESPQQAQVSIIYNASRSLIGRNPVRLVIVSKDAGGKPARINNIQVSHANGNFDSVKIHETEGHLGEFDGMYYVDIEQSKEGVYVPILFYNLEKKELKPIAFIVDCKANIKACLTHPQNLLEYIKVKIEDVLNRR